MSGSGAEATPEALTLIMRFVPPHGEWSATVSVGAHRRHDPVPAAPFVRSDEGGLSPRDLRRQEWVSKIPMLRMGNRSIERGRDDLPTL